MALVAVNTEYTRPYPLWLNEGDGQIFKFRIVIPTDSIGVRFQPLVVIGGVTYALAAERTSYLPDIDLGPGNVSIGYDFTLENSAALLALLEQNNLYGVKVQVQYDLDDGRETGLLDVPYLSLVDKKRNPQIHDLKVYRSENGVEVDDGIEIRIDARLTLEDAANVTGFTFGMHYAENADATENSDYVELVSSIAQEELTVSIVVNEVAFSNTEDWGLLVKFGDPYQYVTIPWDIFKAFANLHLSGKSTGGVCMGGFSRSEEGNPLFECKYPINIGDDSAASTSTPENPKFECHYPAYFYGGIMLGGGGSGDYPAFRTEKKTGGKWMNGKPIYLTVIETGAKTANTMNYDVSEFDIEHYVSIRGLFYAQASYADGYVFPAPAAHMNNVNWTIQLEAMDRTTVTTGATSRTWKSGMIFIEYTKTTDEPGTGDTSNDSGGNTGGSAGGSGSGSVVYSPFEVDTGNKWIDGKTIYRIVLQGAGATGAGGAVIGNLPTNFETVVSIGGTAKRTSTGTVFDNNYNYTSSSRVDTYISSDGSVYCRTAMTDVECIAIIEYTKAD